MINPVNFMIIYIKTICCYYGTFIIFYYNRGGNIMIISDNNDFSVNNVLTHTKKRQPDFNNLIKVLNRKVPDRPTLLSFL